MIIDCDTHFFLKDAFDHIAGRWRTNAPIVVRSGCVPISTSKEALTRSPARLRFHLQAQGQDTGE
jgi:hypothetical protein